MTHRRFLLLDSPLAQLPPASPLSRHPLAPRVCPPRGRWSSSSIRSTALTARGCSAFKASSLALAQAFGPGADEARLGGRAPVFQEVQSAPAARPSSAAPAAAPTLRELQDQLQGLLGGAPLQETVRGDSAAVRAGQPAAAPRGNTRPLGPAMTPRAPQATTWAISAEFAARLPEDYNDQP